MFLKKTNLYKTFRLKIVQIHSFLVKTIEKRVFILDEFPLNIVEKWHFYWNISKNIHFCGKFLKKAFIEKCIQKEGFLSNDLFKLYFFYFKISNNFLLKVYRRNVLSIEKCKCCLNLFLLKMIENGILLQNVLIEISLLENVWSVWFLNIF